MSEQVNRIDAPSKLAGSGKLEMLPFSPEKNAFSGDKETFGINGFRVRKVMRIPEITHAPDMQSF